MIQILYHLANVKSIFPKLNPEGKKNKKKIEFTYEYVNNIYTICQGILLTAGKNDSIFIVIL